MAPRGSSKRRDDSRHTTPRQANPKQAPFSWEDREFYIQIEPCGGIASESNLTHRHDDEKYARYTALLQDGIYNHFDGEMPVEVVEVPTYYSMEVRLMPECSHPRHGARVTGKEAEASGSVLIFSKIQTKKWPRLENILQMLQDMCKVPVRINMLGRELKVGPQPGQVKPYEVHRPTVNVPTTMSRVQSLTALRRVEFHCIHSQGFATTLQTNAEGQVETALFPGMYMLKFDDGSGYDQLTPSTIKVPARFSLTEATITASMKKKCTFVIVDHMNRPFPRFALSLKPQGSYLPAVKLRTKLDGKCRGRVGRGLYVATYDVAENEDPPVAQFATELEVVDTEVPQFFRICVQRVRFVAEIMLRTRFDDPAANCPFTVKNDYGLTVCASTTLDIGVAICDLPAGKFLFRLEPTEESPFVSTGFTITMTKEGTFTPLDAVVQTKVAEVTINLITPDGEPAPGCHFFLQPQFADVGSTGRAREVPCHTDLSGKAICSMGLLEPHYFRVKPAAKAEYMAQQFAFQTDRRNLTAVCARTIFGKIDDDKVVIMVDTSGSMCVYLDDVKAALNTAIVEQFHKSKKHFSIVAFTERVEEFRPNLIDCSPKNIEAALKFCENMEAGGGSDILKGVSHVFTRFMDIDAVYLVTDGKCEIKEAFLTRLRSLYFTHPCRPRMNTIGINCVPRRLTWCGLESTAMMTQGVFRAVCLQQAVVDPVIKPAGMQVTQNAGGDLSVPEVGFTDEEESGEADEDEDFACESP